MTTQTVPRVLFVEDDGSIKLVMSEALRDAGFEVIEAWNAAEAIQLLAAPDSIDLLFTDVRMPGDLDGIDLAMHVRQVHPGMPLLIASGYAAQLRTRLQAVKQPQHFVDKPYDMDKVVAVLWELLEAK